MSKFLHILAVAAILAGCASQPSDDRYINYGQVSAPRVRIPPCNPFYADELMTWATGLEGDRYQVRNARVAVAPSGHVTCSSNEAGGSSSGRHY